MDELPVSAEPRAPITLTLPMLFYSIMKTGRCWCFLFVSSWLAVSWSSWHRRCLTHDCVASMQARQLASPHTCGNDSQLSWSSPLLFSIGSRGAFSSHAHRRQPQGSSRRRQDRCRIDQLAQTFDHAWHTGSRCDILGHSWERQREEARRWCQEGQTSAWNPLSSSGVTRGNFCRALRVLWSPGRLVCRRLVCKVGSPATSST